MSNYWATKVKRMAKKLTRRNIVFCLSPINIYFLIKERKVNSFLNRIRFGCKVRLHLGSGENLLDGYTNIDLYSKKADMNLDACDLKEFADESVDLIENHHLIEHLSFEEAKKAFSEWSRILKPKGWLVISTPHLERVMELWKRSDEKQRWDYGIKMLYGYQDNAGLFHKSGYTPKRLKELLLGEGFTIELVSDHYPSRRKTPSFICVARKKG